MTLYEEAHYLIRMPDESELLWRYISFARYLTMLTTSKLWFSRVDKFDDPFEGAVTPLNAAMREEQIRQFEIHAIPGAKKHFEWFHEGRRRMHYANCWHMNKIESNAMWEKYNSADTVAVVSSRGRFREAVQTDREIFLGKVEYKNYLPGTTDLVDDGNGFGPIFTKRNNFDYEREVRAVLLDVSDMSTTTHDGETFPKLLEGNPAGVQIEVDLEKLIEEVRIHPKSESDFLQTVEAITRKHSLNFPILDSEMNAEPIY